MEPVRCFTCGACLNFDRYTLLTRQKAPLDAFLEMGCRRFCCRRMYLTHPHELDELIRSHPLTNVETEDYAMSFGPSRERCVSTD